MSSISVHKSRTLIVGAQSSIADNKITIFSKSWCPYCKRAKTLLTSKFADTPTKILEYVYLFSRFLQAIFIVPPFHRLDEMEEGDAIQAYLAEKTGQRTVPNIFISKSIPCSHFPHWLIQYLADQKHVGGCDSVVGLDSQGKLAALVSA